jgi:membrane protein implicated in regulation of membrane protease activity
MANPAERRTGSRVADLNGGRRTDFPPAAGEPSVPAALEKIATASQRVLSKRIDLLMLDNHEMISRLLVKAALLSVGVVAGLAAWMSAVAALVTWLVPTWSTAGQLGIFALLNAVVAGAVIAFTLREPPRLSGETEEELEDEAEAASVAGSIARMSERTGTRQAERAMADSERGDR